MLYIGLSVIAVAGLTISILLLTRKKSSVLLEVRHVVFSSGMGESDLTILCELEDGRFALVLHGSRNGKVKYKGRSIARQRAVLDLVYMSLLPVEATVVLVCCYCGVVKTQKVADVRVVPVLPVKTKIFTNSIKTISSRRLINVRSH